MSIDPIFNSRPFKSQPVTFDKHQAQKMELGLPSQWLQNPGLVKLQIKPQKLKAIENPPEKLLSNTDRLLLKRNEPLFKGIYCSNLEITNLSVKKASKNSPKNIKIRVKELLPKHLRKLYGYARAELSLLTGPHSSAILFHNPDYIDRLKKTNEDHVNFVIDNYQKIKRPSNLRFGDHIFFTVKYENPRLNNIPPCRIHSMIYVAPGLAFSKNNFGASSPFYLQNIEKILNLLQPIAENTTMYFEFWRPAV
ncbi:hypothetical protein KKC08_03930 [Patescibacteria group bacterium]|nr:hypothetical protein [Patescibacteria group bacterium]MCG2702247.1 hypothetical protein [Candidatus Parcubacteria bacterium]MBU4264739.1 hypothetical protein [Patescibacteria group bacterium]MBU4390077.1 hypothetical protein [Patescibacteria group bacterium]MBU4397290.1 hypothetical protein [Patescibacteria group bacterium]